MLHTYVMPRRVASCHVVHTARGAAGGVIIVRPQAASSKREKRREEKSIYHTTEKKRRAKKQAIPATTRPTPTSQAGRGAGGRSCCSPPLTHVGMKLLGQSVGRAGAFAGEWMDGSEQEEDQKQQHRNMFAGFHLNTRALACPKKKTQATPFAPYIPMICPFVPSFLQSRLKPNSLLLDRLCKTLSDRALSAAGQKAPAILFTAAAACAYIYTYAPEPKEGYEQVSRTVVSCLPKPI